MRKKSLVIIQLKERQPWRMWNMKKANKNSEEYSKHKALMVLDYNAMQREVVHVGGAMCIPKWK